MFLSHLIFHPLPLCEWIMFLIYTVQRQKLHFLLNGILYVAYEQEIYSLLTLRFHKFEKRSLWSINASYKSWCWLLLTLQFQKFKKTQSVKLWSIVSKIQYTKRLIKFFGNLISCFSISIKPNSFSLSFLPFSLTILKK